MWYICAMEYCSTIKRNKIVPFAETWMDLGTLIQGEVSWKEEKDLLCDNVNILTTSEL